MEDFNGCPYSNIVALNDTLTILSGKWKLNSACRELEAGGRR